VSRISANDDIARIMDSMGLPGNMSKGPEPVVARDLVVVVALEFVVKSTVVTSPPVPSPTVVSDDVSWDEVPVLPLGAPLDVPLVPSPSPPTAAAGVVMVADPPEFDPSVRPPLIAATVAVGVGDGTSGTVVGEGDSVDVPPALMALGVTDAVGATASVGMDVAVAVAVTLVVAIAVTLVVAIAVTLVVAIAVTLVVAVAVTLVVAVAVTLVVAVAVTLVVAVAVTVEVAFVSGTAGSPEMSTQSIWVPRSAGERCRSMA